MKKAKRLVTLPSSRHFVAFGMAAIFVFAGFAYSQSADERSNAQSIDSAVIINSSGHPGPLSLYSTQHTFGTCNSTSNYYFTANSGNVCQGIQFGPPDGVYLHLASTPSGYNFNGFTITYASTDTQNQWCSTSCYFNFSSGSVTVQANFSVKPPAAPSAPSPYISGVTRDSITLQWSPSTPGSGQYIVGYNIAENNTGVGSVTGTSFTHSGLGCNTSHTYRVSAVQSDNQVTYSGYVTGKTSACPAAPPPPAPPVPNPPPTSPSPAPSPAPRTNLAPSAPSPSRNTAPTTSQPQQPANQPDTEAPTRPEVFGGFYDQSTLSIRLTWIAASDNVGVTAYELERSPDQQNWEKLEYDESNISATDKNINFDKKYYYRIRSFDAAGNKSDYATAEVTSGKFEHNVTPDGGSFSSGDVRVTVPAGAVEVNVFCWVDIVSELPELEGDASLINGPYEVICKDQNSDRVELQKPLDIVIDIDTDRAKGHSDVTAYVRVEESWSKAIDATFVDNAVSFVLNPEVGRFAVGGVQRSTPVWIKILVGLFLTAGIGFVLLNVIGRILMKRRMEQEYEDYLRKSQGL